MGWKDHLFRFNVLYNGMIQPLAPTAIRGFIWYQGESNVSPSPENYIRLFPAMIARWRELWDQGDFPFEYEVEVLSSHT